MGARFQVAMATFNGARYLPGQLASVAQQLGVTWRLKVSDDGSTDGTSEILDRFQRSQPIGSVEILQGPATGASRNFMSLIAAADAGSGHFALCDQDDIWCPDRLARAARFLGPEDHPQPRVYASRTWLVDHDGAAPRPSRRHGRTPGFRNALLQNVLAGNTMVLNPAAQRIAARAVQPKAGVPFHDWWLYALLTGAGAQVLLDDQPTVFYRQHAGNMIGAHDGLGATLARLGDVLGTDYGRWLRQNAEALDRNRGLLTPENCRCLDRFCAALASPPVARAPAIFRSGAYRQTLAGGLCVLGAAALGRL